MRTFLLRRLDDGLARKLARLRELLLMEVELPAIWDYFQDFLATDAAFIDAGTREDRGSLPVGFEDILRELEPVGQLSTVLLTRLDTYSMVHGCARWGRGYVFFFVFEDIGQGFCAYSGGLSAAVIEFAQFAVPAEARALEKQTAANPPS